MKDSKNAAFSVVVPALTYAHLQKIRNLMDVGLLVIVRELLGIFTFDLYVKLKSAAVKSETSVPVFARRLLEDALKRRG